MKGDRWIVVVNWDTFQHYSDREPIWIKLYLDLRSRDEWRQLTLSARGLLVCLWIEYAAAQGVLRASDLPSRVAQKNLRRTLDSLQKAGFIKLSASKPSRARSREKKRATSKEVALSKKAERRSPKNGEAPPRESEQLLARAEQMATGWKGPSDEFDANLDTLESELHAHLSYAERSRLWDKALENQR